MKKKVSILLATLMIGTLGLSGCGKKTVEKVPTGGRCN